MELIRAVNSSSNDELFLVSRLLGLQSYETSPGVVAEAMPLDEGAALLQMVMIRRMQLPETYQIRIATLLKEACAEAAINAVALMEGKEAQEVVIQLRDNIYALTKTQAIRLDTGNPVDRKTIPRSILIIQVDLLALTFRLLLSLEESATLPS
jgi:hypothetical protein